MTSPDYDYDYKQYWAAIGVGGGASYGDVQVQFEAEAKPTTVQLIDATGKVIYTEQLNNFDGEYNKELNLRAAASGNIILSIRQGDKTVAKTLLLLNRA